MLQGPIDDLPALPPADELGKDALDFADAALGRKNLFRNIGLDDEERLLFLFLRLLGDEREEHVQPHIDKKAPEERVTPLVEAMYAEEGVRIESVGPHQRADPSIPVHDARFHQRRQKEGVEPDDEPGGDTADGAVAVPPFPVTAEKDRRSEDRDGDEGYS